MITNKQLKIIENNIKSDYCYKWFLPTYNKYSRKIKIKFWSHLYKCKKNGEFYIRKSFPNLIEHIKNNKTIKG